MIVKEEKLPNWDLLDRYNSVIIPICIKEITRDIKTNIDFKKVPGFN